LWENPNVYQDRLGADIRKVKGEIRFCRKQVLVLYNLRFVETWMIRSADNGVWKRLFHAFRYQNDQFN